MSDTFAARSPRRGWTVVTLVGCVLLLALHLSLAAPMRAPIIYGDEAAYLGIARFLAGRPPYPNLAPPFAEWVASYHFGYSLLVAPVWWLSGDPLAVYGVALKLNGVLATALFPLLALWARRTHALPAGDALAVAFAASLYTSFLIQPNIAWSESLLILLIAGLLVLFQHLVARPRTITACGVAVLAVGTYAVHDRAMGLVPITFLALALLWRSRRITGRVALAAGASGVAALVLTILVNAVVIARLWGGSPHRFGLGDAVTRLLAWSAIGNAGLSLIGQVWTLTVASLLLFPLGVWALGRMARRETSDARRLPALFALAVAAVLLATSSLFLTWFPRADLAIYGRYGEAFLAPFLVAGLAGLGSVARRHRIGVWAVTLLPVILTVALLAGHPAAVWRQVYAAVNICGILPAVQLFGGLRLWPIAALGTIAGLAVLAAGRQHVRASACLAGALFLSGGLYVHQTWLVPVQRAGFENRSLPDAVRAVGASEVGYDLAAPRMDEFFAYQFRIGDARYVLFDSRKEKPPGDLIISDSTLGRRWPAARLVFPEIVIDQALWVMPGALQERLAHDGWLVPLDPGAPLPREAECARLTALQPSTTITVRPGGAARIEVRLTHCGAGAPWMPFGPREGPTGAVRLGVRWFQTGTVVVDQRAELPHVIAPGMSADVEVVLSAAASNGAPLPSGRYVVKIGLVQELVRWFAETPTNTLNIEVLVK